MNRKWKEQKKKCPQNSPVLFEDEEKGTSSSDEVNISRSTTPKSVYAKIYSDHSTPIQKKVDSSDFSEMDYNDSPIEPLTQHPPSEVGWNYHRPVTKEENGNYTNSMEITKTPKRGVLLTKKRNSNSPLLYKPMKKKLIQEEQQENMAGFMMELRAMEMKAKEMKDKKGEKSVTPPKTENIVESHLVVDVDNQQSEDSDIKLQISINADESPNKGKITSIAKKYDALLDDSIEDIMVMCSQEVEAKEFGDKNYQFTVQPVNYSTNSISKKEIPLKLSSKSSLEQKFKNLAKENFQPLKTSKKLVSNTCKNSSKDKDDSNSLEIPDDSFDDFFVEIDDKDFCKSVNIEVYIDSDTNKLIDESSDKHVLTKSNTAISSRTVTSHTNTYSRTSAYTVQSKNIASITYSVNDSQASNASVQTKIVNTKANFGYLNKDYAIRNPNAPCVNAQNQSTLNNIVNNSDTRLLKSKSNSDSNFQIRDSVVNYDNTRSIKFSISANEQKEKTASLENQYSKINYYSTGSMGESKRVRRIQSTSSLGNPNMYNSINQRNMSNNNGSQSTPAEIERKRQEAIMKREAKMKNQLSNTALTRPPKNSLKR